MGDGADYALENYIRNGMREPKRKQIIRVVCEHCGKEVHGKAALMQHINAKHEPKKYTWQEICLVHDEEKYL